jgi:UDP-N-acetylmuramate--alanine ligase
MIGTRRIRVGALIGAHMALNATAALVIAAELGLDLDTVTQAWSRFGGVHRRFESHGEGGGVRVYDDYAHHPTEVRATLEAARTLGRRRVVAVFQPHLFSRTRMLARQFGAALALADVVLVLDVYPARERAEDHPGVSGLLVARGAADAARGRRVYWTPAQDDAERLLGQILMPGDVVLTLGAGDVDHLAARLVAEPR